MLINELSVIYNDCAISSSSSTNLCWGWTEKNAAHTTLFLLYSFCFRFFSSDVIAAGTGYVPSTEPRLEKCCAICRHCCYCLPFVSSQGLQNSIWNMKKYVSLRKKIISVASEVGERKKSNIVTALLLLYNIFSRRFFSSFHIWRIGV